MKILRHKIPALLFILIGATPLFFIIFTGVRQQQIRKNMEHRLESSLLHSVSLDISQVHWVKAGKEILVNGKMFDVKSSRPCGDDKIIFTGLFDDEETALLHKVKETQQKNNNADGKLLTNLFQLFQAINISNDNVSISYRLIINYPMPDEALASPYIPVLSPPPQA